MKPTPLFPAVTILVLFSITPSARSDDMYIWAEEVGGNVIFLYEGSIDLTGFPPPIGELLSPSIDPNAGSYLAIDSESDTFNGVIPHGATRTFGTGGFTAASFLSGDTFATGGDTMGLPLGYSSGAPISGSMTFNGETLASLGVDTTPFSYATTVGTNTIHMFTDPADVAAAEARIDLLRQIKKLKRKAKNLKRKGKKARAKKLLKKVKKLKKQLATL